MSFKEVTSLYKDIEEFLNKESRLDRNSEQDTRPDVMQVKQEIMKQDKCKCPSEPGA